MHDVLSGLALGVLGVTLIVVLLQPVSPPPPQEEPLAVTNRGPAARQCCRHRKRIDDRNGFVCGHITWVLVDARSACSARRRAPRRVRRLGGGNFAPLPSIRSPPWSTSSTAAIDQASVTCVGS